MLCEFSSTVRMYCGACKLLKGAGANNDRNRPWCDLQAQELLQVCLLSNLVRAQGGVLVDQLHLLHAQAQVLGRGRGDEVGHHLAQGFKGYLALRALGELLDEVGQGAEELSAAGAQLATSHMARRTPPLRDAR